MVIHNRTHISDFINHSIFPADTPHVVKCQFHLNKEGVTCGPFAIMVGEKLNEEEWEVCYYHTGHHGAAVVQKLGSLQASYLVDSSLQSMYEIPTTPLLGAVGTGSTHIKPFCHYRMMPPQSYTQGTMLFSIF